jgi:hypothetical protein
MGKVYIIRPGGGGSSTGASGSPNLDGGNASTQYDAGDVQIDGGSS